MEPDNHSPFPPDARFYLDAEKSLDTDAYGFHAPLYANLSAMLIALKTELENIMDGRMLFKRTLESGSVEEYVIFSRDGVKKKLLFRVWPVFYARDKRLEYKIHESDERVRALVEEYLHLCARANGAGLKEK